MYKEKSVLRLWVNLNWRATLNLASIVTAAISTLNLSAQAALLAKWQFDPAANRLEVTLNEQTTPRYFVLAQPPRIVLDLPNTTLGKVETQQTYSGAVRQIRVAQFQSDITRIVIELSPDVVLEPKQVQLRPSTSSANTWVLRPLIVGAQPPQSTPVSPTTLPPATFENARTSVVKVPPLNRLDANITPVAKTNLPSPTLPPATSGSDRTSNVSVPRLQTTISPNPESATLPVVEFGQPLQREQRQELQVNPGFTIPIPENSTEAVGTTQPPVMTLPMETGGIPTTTAKPTVAVPSLTPTTATKPLVTPTSATSESAATAGNSSRSSSEVVLPTGTQLTLRYPGQKALTLQAGSPQQEVLVLQEALRDRAGNIIAIAGTQVSGRFETDASGSRFIAQTITIKGRNLPISAQSVLLPSNRLLLQNIIQPNQILPVQLTEDLR